MKDQLKLIFELNQWDLKIQECQEALQKIPERQEEIETLLKERETVLEEKKKRLEDLETQRRGKEREVETAEFRLRELQGKLSQIKTNREYQAALKEVAETKKANKALEDQILEGMTEGETVKKEIQADDAALQDLLKTRETTLRELGEEEKRLRGRIGEMEEEKKGLLGEIEEKVLDQYRRIKKVRRDAVSFVEKGTCLGCNMHIPPQLFIEIQKLKAVHTCPSCLRILYLQEWREGERKVAS